jgi:hypothetical protein
MLGGTFCSRSSVVFGVLHGAFEWCWVFGMGWDGICVCACYLDFDGEK